MNLAPAWLLGVVSKIKCTYVVSIISLFVVVGLCPRGEGVIRATSGSLEVLVESESLVYVPAASSYASVFAVGENGVCEVGLIDPGADDYSLRVPMSALEEMEEVGADRVGELAERLALLHLRVRRGMDTPCAFEVFVGRSEEGGLELWFSRGLTGARHVRDLDEREERELAGALCSVDLAPWRRGGPEKPPSLDVWSWSMQAIGAGLGVAGYGRGAAPEGLASLVGLLSSFGLDVAWGDDGPYAEVRK
jgi:hypothetical protein